MKLKILLQWLFVFESTMHMACIRFMCNDTLPSSFMGGSRICYTGWTHCWKANESKIAHFLWDISIHKFTHCWIREWSSGAWILNLWLPIPWESFICGNKKKKAFLCIAIWRCVAPKSYQSFSRQPLVHALLAQLQHRSLQAIIGPL